VTVHGQIIYDNPPVHFWITSAFYRIFGQGYYSSVLASALFALGTVLLSYFLALRMFGSQSLAFVAALILILPGYFHDYARRGMLDQTLVFFFTLALFAVWLGRKRPIYFLLFGFSAAMAILTKSVLGALVIPVALLFLLLSNDRRRLIHPWFLAGIVVIVAIVGIWFSENYQAGGSHFLKSHFGSLISARVVEGTHSTSPSAYLGYFSLLFQNYWPWLPFTLFGMFLAAKSWRKELHPAAILLLVWSLGILLVMSLTSSKILRYILNIFPALAILSAWGLHTMLSRWNKVDLGLKVGVAFAVCTLLLINITPITFPGSTGLSEHSVEIRALAPYIELNSDLDEGIINFRLERWDPQNIVYLYSQRLMEMPIGEAAEVARRLEENPDQLILCETEHCSELMKEFPNLFYQVKAAGKYHLLTSATRRYSIRYD
ncbi:glycosyltransferase family 39 protein, partial [bacterium]|nr:glycosyltransferase family 39 protein [bacterium]